MEMKTKTIYEYDGELFDDPQDVDEYIADKIGGNYNNIDPMDTPKFLDEVDNIETTEREWHTDSSTNEISATVQRLFKEYEIIVRTTKDKKHLNAIIKNLQIATNRIDVEGFYGK